MYVEEAFRNNWVVKNKPPHLKPTGRSAMLQRFGMVTAISGFTPDILAVFESITAQRQLGFWPILFTWLQQLAETGACASCAADAQGNSFKASLSALDFPHSPAPYAPLNWLTPRIARNAMRQMYFIGASISSIQCRKHLSTSCFYTAIGSSKDTWLVTEKMKPTRHSGGSTGRRHDLFIAAPTPPEMNFDYLATLGHWKLSPLTKVLATIPLLLSFQRTGAQGHFFCNR